MTHCDAGDLALIALAETEATPAEREHLASCPECSRDLLALQRTVDVARAPRVELLVPDPAVWGRIHSELGLSEAVAQVPAPADAAGPASAAAAVASPRHPAPPAPAATEPAPVVTIFRARRLWIPLAAAAVLGLAAGYAASSWWPSAGGDSSVLARAELEPLPGWTGAGEATVETTASGRRDVVVSLGTADAVSPDAPLREVWLLSPDATSLVSLGLLDGTSGRFVIPAEIDLEQYPLVDVSAEPNDGDPAHSADSVARGDLRSS